MISSDKSTYSDRVNARSIAGHCSTDREIKMQRGYDMEKQERSELSPKILQVIQSLQSESNTWVPFASVGTPLTVAGIQYKEYGFLKLRPFLNEFCDILEFRDEEIPGKPPVCYVRPKDTASNPLSENSSTPAVKETASPYPCDRVPTEDSWLTTWAAIPAYQYKALAELALDEKWYYGSGTVSDREEFPILRNYLNYTFKRLCFEKKVLIRKDTERNEEYAALNTGLVDKKYEYIYALFKENTRYPTPYWYLLDFVVAGEDAGKTLNKFFNPLPERADYFENRIENMLYDSSTGALICDYTHIIAERTYRLPKDFLVDNCPADMLCIDGIGLDEAYNNPDFSLKRNYFSKLGQKIRENSRIFNRMKNRLDDAVELAKKRTEWNYKTAIPTYYPARNNGSLLLPLSLVDEEHVDLALVVIRNPSGSYQGETILPLDLAYSNSRLVTRPDSDWLKTEVIWAPASDMEDDGED